MKTCPKCQNPIHDNYLFCPKCGENLKNCRHCGKELPEGANFCPYCGKSMKAETTTPKTPSPEEFADIVSSRRICQTDRVWCWYTYPIIRNNDSLQKEMEFLKLLESAGLQITSIGFEELHDWDDWDYELRSYSSIPELTSDTEAMGFIRGTWKAAGLINNVIVYITFLDSAGPGRDRIYISCKKPDSDTLFNLLCSFEPLYHVELD